MTGCVKLATSSCCILIQSIVPWQVCNLSRKRFVCPRNSHSTTKVEQRPTQSYRHPENSLSKILESIKNDGVGCRWLGWVGVPWGADRIQGVMRSEENKYNDKQPRGHTDARTCNRASTCGLTRTLLFTHRRTISHTTHVYT